MERHPGTPPIPPTFCGLAAADLLRAAARRGRFLLDVRFGLVGRFILILQGFARGLVRWRRWHVRRGRAGIRSLRQPSGSLLRGQFLHPGIQLLLEVVVHLLQVVHRNRPLLPAAQSPFLLLVTLTFTFWSPSGVSVSRVITSP